MLKKTAFTKNILRFVALIIVLALSLISFSGCVFVKENQNRVFNQNIITINGANNIKMTLTQNELIDYYNSYAYYLINYYGYSVEQALDFVVDSKIKTKYLLTIAMGELTTNFPQRQPVLYGGGKMETVEQVLTYAEYYSAVQTVNESILSSIDTLIESAYQERLNSNIGKIDRENIEKIEFTPETLEYLKDEYLVKEDIDTDSIKFRVVYKAVDGKESTYSKEYIVPKSMYIEPFSSEEEKGDATLEISFDEKIVSSSGTTYKAHHAAHEYKVVKPRATKEEKEEEIADEISIGDIKVNRYDTLATLKSKNAVVEKLDVVGEYNKLKNDPSADSMLRDAYRQVNENLTKGNKTMEYIYNSTFESAVVSALQEEVQKGAVKDKDNWDAEILKQYKFLYEASKDGYAGDKSDKDKAKDFMDKIKSNLDEYYYHPKIENLSDYIYVYQILFNFDDEQQAWLKDVINEDSENDALNNKHYEAMKDLITTKESNPSYDPDFDCPLHEKNEAGAVCKWEEENGEGICPSIAYIRDDVKFSDVFAELQAKLADPANINDRLAIFEDYMYRYNDDGGIMNSPTGYLIAPKGVDDPNGFYQSFVGLAHDVYAHSKDVGNAFTADGKLGYAFTPYGVHIIMVSMRPFETDTGQELLFDENDDEKMLEYIKNTVINLNGDTIYSVLKKEVISEAKNLAYTNFTNNRISNDIKDNKDIVQIDNKKLDKLFGNYKG